MRAKAALYYVWHKYTYEVRYDNYQMDMLRLIASAYLKEPPPRYYDIIESPKNKNHKKTINYTVNDVVDMFAGKGKLV